MTEDGKLVRIEERPRNEWIEIPGATPAIIPKNEFDRVQATLKQPRKRLTSDPRQYLLRSYICCGYCGSPMIGTKLNRRYRYYQSVNARSFAYRPATCSARYVPAQPLEETVWREVVQILEDPSVILEELNRRRAADEPYRQADLVKVSQLLKSLDRQKAESCGWVDSRTSKKPGSRLNYEISVSGRKLSTVNKRRLKLIAELISL